MESGKRTLGPYEERYNKCVGRALQEIAARCGKTQTEVAEQLGVSQSYVSRIERGDATVSPWRLRMLLSIYQVDYYSFFTMVETFFSTGAG